MQPAATGHTRFFQRSGPHRLADIATAAGGSVASNGDLYFDGVAPLQAAGPGQISFLDNRRYAALLDVTRAGAVIAPETPTTGGRPLTPTHAALKLCGPKVSISSS